MSKLRKLERSVVKAKSRKGFSENWKSYREQKYVTKDENGNVIKDNTPRNTQKKKQNHYDNVSDYNRLFQFMQTVQESRDKGETEDGESGETI